jgi:L-asparaginase II
MSEVLVNVTRGPLVESIHRGDIAVVDSKGQLLYHVGNPHKVSFMRSAAKPIQTLNVILSGAADRFNFTEEELAIMCASHYGEDFHRKVVEGILNKIGLSVDNLLCGATLSLSPKYAEQLIWNHVKLKPTHTDCSGKHSGMLAVCIHKGYSINNYNIENHSIQRELKSIAAKICGINKDEIYLGIDGCTVPVYGMPLYNMALGFAKLANANSLSKEYTDACDRVFRAMNKAPEMISGTNGFCTELIKNTKGKLIGKLGAEAVYCIGVKDRDLGIAIKVEDGNYRAVWPTVIKCLEDLGVLEENESISLQKYRVGKNLNNIREEIGEVRAAFDLVKN